MDKRRVCHISSAHSSYDERIFHKESVSLAKEGYKVTLIAISDEEMYRNEVKILPLEKPEGHFSRIKANFSSLFHKALAERANIYHFHDPDLIPVGIILKLLGKKVIYDVHEDYEKKLLSRDIKPYFLKVLVAKAFTKVEKFASLFFDYIIAADRVVAAKFPKHKTEVIANFPPRAFGFKACSQKKNDDKFRLVFVGGVSEVRGVGVVLKAIELLDPNVVFHIAGEIKSPSLRDRLLNNQKVVYHGRIPWEKLPEFLTQMHVGVAMYQPLEAFTYYPGENVVKLFEYMACGLPVIISDFPNFKTLMEELDVGLCVDPTSPEKIAEAINYLRKEKDAYQRMSKNGQRWVEEKFNWEEEEKKLLTVYERVLKEK